MTDIQADGILDAVVADAGSSDLWVGLGNGSGSIAFALSLPLPRVALGARRRGFSTATRSATFVAAEPASGKLAFLLSFGLSWSPPVEAAVGAQPGSIVIADFDLDGKLDVACANQGPGTVSVLLGNGSGDSRRRPRPRSGSSPFRWHRATSIATGAPTS